MGLINISSEEASYTSISNNFIEYYMTDANGDFVKVYLYLAMLSCSKRDISLGDIADHLNCTENDVCRAIRYWIREDAIRLVYSDAEKRDVKGIVLLNPKKPEDVITSELKFVDFRKALSGERSATPATDISDEETVVSKPPRKKQPAPSELSEKLHDKEIQDLIAEATAYCNRDLTQKELNSLIYIKDQLGFSFDLAEYLLEYCAELKKTSFNYIEKVARNWYEEGITNREDAADYSIRFLTLYGKILKTLGITNRYTPAPVEKRYIDKWLNDFGFSETIIIEACNRAIERKPNSVSFPYVNGILESWYTNGVTTFQDISKMDESHKTAKSSEKKSAVSRAKSDDKLRKLEEYYLQEAYDN